MKKTIIILAVATFSSVQIFCQTNINTTKMIPLKVGRENPPVQFETLHIKPIYLIVQNENDRSPNVELRIELNAAGNNNEYSTTLAYSYNDPNIYYPRAFENYLLGLEINEDGVHLTVEKLDFGKEFYLELNQKAVIGNFSVTFESTMSDWSVDRNGNYLESRAYFNILLSDGTEQKGLRFQAIHARGSDKKLMIEGEDDLQTVWKNYRISLLDASGRILKLVVSD